MVRQFATAAFAATVWGIHFLSTPAAWIIAGLSVMLVLGSAVAVSGSFPTNFFLRVVWLWPLGSHEKIFGVDGRP
jgi:hypothetical protein